MTQKANAGEKAFQESTKILSDYLSSTTDTPPATTASAIVTSVNASSKPADTGFEVTNLLLDTVAQFSTSHDPIIALLPAIRAIPPTPNPVYYHLESMHRENYDGISGLRYLWKPEDKQATTTPGDRWVNYNVFTAKLATSGYDNGYFMFGFFCLRDTLEKERESREDEVEKHIRPFSLERSAIGADDVLNYDLIAAADWVVTGASHMYRLGNSIFVEGLERGIAVKTDFWNGEPGLSSGRWRLWQSRFEYFAEEPYVKEGVRVLCKAAVVAIGKVLLTKVD
ncbi:uncharacterized protein J4E78_009613 [Alternaria triticimaculans]|uniref:uncharacterized protein n=1 Tax=Alternaria triticimaculans TaxID=297637 RepID=UPI0020C3B542|nr:uncharacterized protein J4E78_009613 [Alternaria triticimaculans]KAI4644794.1 hypothetical protein J4E78_009613 [Alternaria triticimaculans]